MDSSINQAISRPDRANKKPQDLGVLGLKQTKQVIESIKGPSKQKVKELEINTNDEFTSASWGKESKDAIDQKAKYVKDSRVRQNDQYAMLKLVASVLFKMFLMQKLSRSALALVLGETRAKQVVWAALAVGSWYKWGAWSLQNSGKSPILRLPFIGSLPQLAWNVDRFHNYMLEVLRGNKFQHAELTLPGMGYIPALDARDREYVLKTNFRNYLKNRENDMGSFEYVLGDVLGRGIFAVDKREWQDARKIASHMFSGASLKAKMEDVFNEHADKVVHLLQTKVAGTGKRIDMQEVFQCAIFDAFCEIAFGYYPNATEAVFEGKKPEFLVAFDTCQALAVHRFLIPPVIWHLQRLFGYWTGQGPEGTFDKNLKIIIDYCRPIIEERKKDAGVTSKSDLLSLYINHARETNQPHMLDHEFLQDTIINFMIAGRDTTSCTLTYMTRYLGENPEAEARMLQEAVLPIASKGDKVNWDNSRMTPYADAVFNETLRMAPPVGDDIRICVGDDVWPSGIKIRDGTRLIIANVTIGRDPFLWENPEQFDPERWMAYDEKGVPAPVKRVDEYIHPVFFSGRRLCLGKDMARFETIVFMTKLFSKLRIIPEPLKDDTVSTGPVIFLQEGSFCRIERR